MYGRKTVIILLKFNYFLYLFCSLQRARTRVYMKLYLMQKKWGRRRDETEEGTPNY